MTKNEICRNYRLAKNKAEQIKILADLNRTTAEKIRAILAEGGEKIVEPPKSNRGRKKAGSVPQEVSEILWQEIEILDAQIKELEVQMKPLKDRYLRIANFLKAYGGKQ